MKPIRSPYSLNQVVQRQRRATQRLWLAFVALALVWFLSGCTCTGLNRQSLDQVNAAIESAEGFKARAEASEPVAPVLIDVHLDNLNGLKANLERAVDDE